MEFLSSSKKVVSPRRCELRPMYAHYSMYREGRVFFMVVSVSSLYKRFVYILYIWRSARRRAGRYALARSGASRRARQRHGDTTETRR